MKEFNRLEDFDVRDDVIDFNMNDLTLISKERLGPALAIEKAGERFKLTKSVTSAVSKWLHLPSGNWMRSNPRIANMVFEECKKERQDLFREFYGLFYQGAINEISVDANFLRSISPHHIIDTVKNAGLPLTQARMFPGRKGYELEFTSDRYVNPPGLNDDNAAGLWVGVDNAIHARSFVHTKICTNGLMGRHYVTEKRTFDFNPEYLKEVYSRSETLVNDLVKLYDIKVEDKTKALAGILMSLGYKSDAKMSLKLLNIINEKGCDTLYSVVQAITSYANSYRASEKPNRRLQSVGHLLESYDKHEYCDRCLRII